MAKTMKELREIIESMTAEELEKKLCGECKCEGKNEGKDKATPATDDKQVTKGRRGRKPKAETMPEPEVEANPYDGMSAKELFNLCKERKIKAEIKKPADYYIDLLKKDDAKKAKEEAEKAEKDDDDWGDDEEPANGKKAEPEKDDDDDDWDI